jgi:hypothetical protein
VRLTLIHLAPHLRAVVVLVAALRRPTDRIPVPDDPAFVLAIDPVVDHRATVTARAAAAQFRV